MNRANLWFIFVAALTLGIAQARPSFEDKDLGAQRSDLSLKKTGKSSLLVAPSEWPPSGIPADTARRPGRTAVNSANPFDSNLNRTGIIESRWAPSAPGLVRAFQRADHCSTGRVGVLLPLTGEYRALGQDVLRGLRLALSRAPLSLVISDTQGDTTRVQKAFNNLLTTESVCLIVGPVGHLESEEAARLAETFKIPLISVSARPKLTQGRTFVFRYRLGYRLAAETIAAYAMESLGIKRFAILHPNTVHGKTYRSAFWKAVKRRGGVIRGSRAYPIKPARFDEAIRGLIGRLHVDDLPIDRHWAQLNRKMKNTAFYRPPQVDFEGLFIPDSGRRIRILLPLLGYWDIETRGDPNVRPGLLAHKYLGDAPPVVTILGGPHFLASGEAQTMVHSVGAHFVSSYWMDTELGQRFEGDFRSTFKSSPSELSAFGYAVGRLLARVTDHANLRSVWRRALYSLGSWDSIFGRVSLESDGEIQIEPRVLTIDPREGIIPVTRPTVP